MPGIGELMVIMMILVVLPLIGVWVWMVVDCATNEAPSERIAWLLVILLAGFIGALIYLFVRRPKRRAAIGR